MVLPLNLPVAGQCEGSLSLTIGGDVLLPEQDGFSAVPSAVSARIGRFLPPPYRSFVFLGSANMLACRLSLLPPDSPLPRLGALAPAWAFAWANAWASAAFPAAFALILHRGLRQKSSTRALWPTPFPRLVAYTTPAVLALPPAVSPVL